MIHKSSYVQLPTSRAADLARKCLEDIKKSKDQQVEKIIQEELEKTYKRRKSFFYKIFPFLAPQIPTTEHILQELKPVDFMYSEEELIDAGYALLT